MFIKPFKIKNNIQIKGSDVKKLKTKIAEKFKISESVVNSLMPNKASYQAVKIITHTEQQVTVYTMDKKPMIFELEEKFYPTLYAVWLCSEPLVPHFTTFPNVLPKLANGADLMMPGVVKEGSDLKSFGRFNRDDVVAVNLTSNKSAVGIGFLAKNSEDMYMSGGHGVCVKMVHVFGDKLWGFEPSVTQQIPLSGPVLKAPSLDTDEFPPLGGEPTKAGSQQVKPQPKAQVETLAKQLDNLEVAGNVSPQLGDLSLVPTVNPDDILKGMFFTSLKLNKKELLGALPMLVSTFYPSYVQKQPQPDADKPITIKDTSFKKVSTFIKKMNELGVIVVKEEAKGIEKIILINFEHPDLLGFKLIKSPEAKTISNVETAAASHLLLTKMTELFVVNEATQKFFNSMGVPEGKSLDSTQIKNYVKDYVGRNKLIDGVSKGIILDDILVKMCIGKRETTAPILMNVDHVAARVLNQMDNTFEMRSQTNPQMKGGKKAIIQITTATRMGNKKVTLINNLEAYGINMAEFSKTCKIGVQASTSITKVPGTSINQFQIQGNHVKFIHNLLVETYQIAKGNITGLEFAKKEKVAKKK